MLSRRGSTAGRAVQAVSLTSNNVSKYSGGTFYSGVVSVTMETTSVERRWSTEAPWPQLQIQLRTTDRWLQITSISYSALDASSLGTMDTERTVKVDAETAP